MTFVRLSDWPSDLTSCFTRTYCHTTHQWKYLKVNITFNVWSYSWLLKVFYAISQTKATTSWKWIIIQFACIILRQKHVHFWNFTDVWCDTRVGKRRHFRSIMLLVNFIVLNYSFATFFIRIWSIHIIFICFTRGVLENQFWSLFLIKK